ncbi:hypothetical protein A3A09_00225 [Candidatus Nomurabacteria bacterium RIFCSPLOWO2_01_FULL_42_20]|uniref:Glutaredoxin domain-containing protein n=1 Tax=Candidatus Nomurabacteria bacterium RIFCSPHIGHO2_01_FULL_42_16 TaxID=1801743 RepID=A0A1F6VIQ3_9BACT|nr:MAG: hypothetical protein A2824_03575 [Candidatus Nomurabacteria bacterium RIFCSPHIGHO2_01_FULL_42_16]OGI91225.1 MAG: hypothetical protein A3A09_00225 [Candidatus Nomurabacteria bacterium RIFCSPLOWO2_01_FULL_42_20]
MTKKITIYSTPSCHFCHAAKDFFKENKIKFTDYDVSTDMERRKEMIDLTGQMGVPVIVIGDPSDPSGQAETLIGFDKRKIKELLGL